MTRDEIKAIYHAGEDTVIDFVEQLLRLMQQQQSQIDSLTARVKELEARLSQNSRNSSKPPSSDSFGKQTRSLRKARGRKRGGQKGHPPALLKQVEKPDETVVHQPESCEACRRSLAEVTAFAIEHQRRQVFDLPPLKLFVTEHRVGCKQCPCCLHKTVGEFPLDVPVGASYGSGVKALALFLHKEQLLPTRRTCQIFEALFSSAISEGTLQAAVESCSAELKEVEELIKEALSQASQANFDETGFYVESKRSWLHVAATESLTHYGVNQKRGSVAMTEIGILPVFRGTATHDGLSAYMKYACVHSLCNAHHLRELTFLHEEMNREWAASMKEFLVKVKEQVDKAKAAGRSSLNKRTAHLYAKTYDQILRRGRRRERLEPELARGSRGRPKQSKAKNLLDRLQKYKKETLKFMNEFAVPFDNNLAERDLRMMKVQQKISGCFRTRQGAEDFCRIKTYLSTMKKQGHNLLQALKSVFDGDILLPVLTG